MEIICIHFDDFISSCREANMERVNFYLNSKRSMLPPFDMSQEEIFLERLFAYSCFAGNLEVVKFFIAKGAKNWESALAMCCAGAHYELMLYLIEVGTMKDIDLHNAFIRACFGGNMQIVNFLIEKGVSDWDGGFCGACRGHRAEVMKFMIEKGLTKKKCECGLFIEEHYFGKEKAE